MPLLVPSPGLKVGEHSPPQCSALRVRIGKRGDTAFTLGASAAPALLPNIGFRHDSDFAPVIKLTTSNHVLVVNPSVPAKSIVELVALLKSQPDKLNFSSGDFGTPAHLMGELFRLQTGVRVAHVPYKALPQAIGDLLNGTNHFQFITPLPVLDLIAIAVEEGFPDLTIQDWVGFVVKSGTPDAIVARLSEATNKAFAVTANARNLPSVLHDRDQDPRVTVETTGECQTHTQEKDHAKPRKYARRCQAGQEGSGVARA
jgi:tripartite-type tricarboxylate transporter receptor subunit TctC